MAAIVFSECVAWTAYIAGIFFGIIGVFSTLEAAHSYFQRRGSIMRFVGKILLSRAFTLAVIVTSAAALYALKFGVPSWAWDRDLRMTVNSYYYNKETNELTANVQFTNDGSSRRTVLGALFTYRANNELHDIVNSWWELHAQGQTPLYIEPGHPEVAIYKYKLHDATLVSTPGVIFGLEVVSLKPRGGRNWTQIEVMAIINDLGGMLGARQENISLDIVGGNYPMHIPAVLPRPSLIPNKEASPPEPAS